MVVLNLTLVLGRLLFSSILQRHTTVATAFTFFISVTKNFMRHKVSFGHFLKYMTGIISNNLYYTQHLQPCNTDNCNHKNSFFNHITFVIIYNYLHIIIVLSKFNSLNILAYNYVIIHFIQHL